VRRFLPVLLFALSTTAPIVLSHPDSAGATTHTVAIEDSPNCGASMFCYSPPSLAVTAGDTVTWVNNSAASLKVIRCEPSACPGMGSGGRPRGPASPRIHANGGTFSYTFTRGGKYNYFSAIRGQAMMYGTITVVAATTPTTASTTSTTVPTIVPTTITHSRTARNAPSAEAATHQVAIDGSPNCGTSMFCYTPPSLTVTEGDTVAWTNNSTAPHTVTRCDASACSGNGPGTGGESGPSSPTINPRGTFSFTFTSLGTYLYYCEIHGYAMMHGTITVVAATTPTTSSTTSTTIGSSTTTTPTVQVSSATSPGGASANQLARTGALTSQGVAAGLILFVLGLGLMAASTARRPSSRRSRVSGPESSPATTAREDFGAE
jgi:plastocyanin